MKIMVLDIGGTAIKSAVCEDGVLTDLRETPTQASLGGAHVMDQACLLIEAYTKSHALSRIGISTAGQVDPAAGTIIYANENIPGYTGTPVAAIMEKRFHLPTCVENDVNAAAIGESIYGAGRGHQDFVCLTYGTGVGGAVFSGGRIFHGSSCSAGEFGAIVTHPEDRIPAEDMFTGCYEKYASVTALVRHAMQLDPSLSNGRIIFARRNEPDVCRLIDAWILEIVYGLTTIVHMLNPSCMILGGGVMEQDFLTDRIRAVLMEHIMPGYRHLTLCQAQLGNQAGLLGASVLHTL